MICLNIWYPVLWLTNITLCRRTYKLWWRIQKGRLVPYIQLRQQHLDIETAGERWKEPCSLGKMVVLPIVSFKNYYSSLICFLTNKEAQNIGIINTIIKYSYMIFSRDTTCSLLVWKWFIYKNQWNCFVSKIYRVTK